jgi:hypothetical protein
MTRTKISKKPSKVKNARDVSRDAATCRDARLQLWRLRVVADR